MTTYVVTQGAVTLATGRKNAQGKPEVLRLLHGTKIEANPDNPKIKHLLSVKAVKKFKENEAVPKATARMVAKALGSPDDPALAPRPDVQPMSQQQAAVASLGGN